MSAKTSRTGLGFETKVTVIILATYNDAPILAKFSPLLQMHAEQLNRTGENRGEHANNTIDRTDELELKNTCF